MALTPLDFPASPTVGQLYPDPPVTGQPTYRWDGAQWLSYAAASLPTPTKPANYGKKNYIINGAMQVSQENGTTAVTTSGYYPVDMFSVTVGSTGVLSSAQGFASTPAGSPNRIHCAVTTADTSVAAGEIVAIITTVEGLRMADLKSGLTDAKTITIQFGVRAPAGTYCVTVQNAGITRAYVSEYTITAGEANTDVVKSVTLQCDTTGTWASNNTAGFYISWVLLAGTTFRVSPGSWLTTAGTAYASTNQSNFMGTNGNIFQLFDVSLTEGSVAPPFQVPDYASELAACQRYYVRNSNTGGFSPYGLAINATWTGGALYFPRPMRSAPTMLASFSSNAGAVGVGATSTVDSYAAAMYNSSSNWTVGAIIGIAYIANARL